MPNSITVDLSGRLDKLEKDRREATEKASEIFARTTGDKNGEGERDMTADEISEVRELQTRAKSCQQQIDQIREQLDLTKTDDPDAVVLTRTAGSTRSADGEEVSEEEREYHDAFMSVLRFGERRATDKQLQLLESRMNPNAVSAEERAMSVGTDSAGGYTVPEGFWGSIVDKMAAYTWFGQAGVSIINTATGNDIPIPVSDGTAEVGALLAENTAAADEDADFTQLMLQAYLFTSKRILTSRVLAQDSGVPFENFLSTRLATRLGRTVSAYATTGTGTSQPYGIVTQATTGVTAAGTTAITLDETIELQHSLDPAYRMNAGWMFHDSVFEYLRKLKDTDGRPLWMPSLIEGVESTLLGKRYTINQNMASSIAASASTMLFGDFSYFYIRNAMSPIMLMIDDSLRTSFQYGYVMFQRMGSILTDTSAVKKLVQAAS